MRRFCCYFTCLPLSLAAIAPAVAEQIVLEEGGAVLTAPENISCSTPPVLTLEGDIAALFGNDRGIVNRLTSTMGNGLAQACPDVPELTVEGSDRGVEFRFVIRGDTGWRLPDDSSAPPAEETTAAAEAPSVVEEEPETEVAESSGDGESGEIDLAGAVGALGGSEDVKEEPAAAEEPKEPEIAPGLPFSQLAQFFGPVPEIRGHTQLVNHDTWNRIMAARAYSYRPSIVEDDQLALELASMMLNPAEMQQFLGASAQQVQHGNRYNFQALSVFDRRDLANRVRTQLMPYLDQRRQTGPIDVYHAIQVRLGEYSFDTQSFPMNVHNNRGHPTPQWQQFRLQGALNSVVFPTELKSTVDQARQLDAYLRSRNDNRLYLGVFLSVDPRPPASLQQGHNIPVEADLKQVALFADEQLTQVVFDFTSSLAGEQAEVARVAEELARPVLNGERLVKSLALINETDAPVKAAIDAFSLFSNLTEPDKLARQEQAKRALDAVDGQKTVRFEGTLRVRPYDSALKGLPVERVNTRFRNFEGFQLGMQLNPTFFPSLTVLPMSEAEAERVLQASQNSYSDLEMRLEADLVQGAHTAPSQEYLMLSATFQPKRVLLFSGHQNGIPADRRLLADVELPDAPGGGALPFEMIKLGE